MAMDELKKAILKLAQESGERPPTDALLERAISKIDGVGLHDVETDAKDVWAEIQNVWTLVPRRNAPKRDNSRQESLPPPESWTEYSRYVFRYYLRHREKAMDVLGLVRPLRLEQVEEFLHQMAEKEGSREGDALALVYPRGEGSTLAREVGTLYVRRGLHYQEYLDRALGIHPDTRDLPGGPHSLTPEESANTWRAGKQQALAQLVDLSEEVSTWTGVRKHEAVAFLLCDLVPLLPWLRATAHRKSGSGVPHDLQTTITIHVGSLDIRPKEVGKVYAKIRRRILLPDQESGSDTLGPDNRARPPAEESRRMFYFVESRARTGRRDWDRLFSDYSERYPNQYKDKKSMQRAYYRAKGADTRGG